MYRGHRLANAQERRASSADVRRIRTYPIDAKRLIGVVLDEIALMDEPTVGIDPQSRRILDTVIELDRQELTVLYTAHDLEEAQELSNRVGIIDHGQLIAIGTQMAAQLIKEELKQ